MYSGSISHETREHSNWRVENLRSMRLLEAFEHITVCQYPGTLSRIMFGITRELTAGCLQFEAGKAEGTAYLLPLVFPRLGTGLIFTKLVWCS